MKTLSRESRLLIDAARDGDEPSAADQKRVRGAIAKRLALGAAAAAVAATATHAASGGATGVTAGVSAGAGTGVGAGLAGTALAAGGTSAGVGSIAAGAMTASFGAKVLVSVALLGAMSAGTVGYVRHEEAKRTDLAASSLEPAAARPPRGAASTPAVKSPFLPSASPSSVPVPVVTLQAPAPVAVAHASIAPALPTASALGPAKTVSVPPPSPPLASAAPAAPAPSDLDAELALLQDAHAALRANDGLRALRILDEHTRRFPNGALGEESEAARVFALCQVGRPAEARDVAGRFLREHPRSPLAPRVAHACDPESAGQGPTF
jgi:hypothetical protein